MNDYKLALSVDEIKNYVDKNTLVALDIETSPFDKYRNDAKASLDSNKAKIIGLSLSVKEGTGIYVPFFHLASKNADFRLVWPWLKDNILNDKNKTLVIHNAAFESSFFYALGTVIQANVYDTMVAAQLTLKTKTEFRNLSDSGLKKLVPQLLKVKLPTFEEVVSQEKIKNYYMT